MLLPENHVGLAIASPDDVGREIYENSDLVAQLIREALLQSGLGKADPEAPLRDLIDPGMTVLLKPNWVLHRNKGGHGMACMITHPQFIESVIREVLLAKPGKIIVGDSPIQRCDFDALISDEFRERIQSICAPCPVEIQDFRREIAWQEDGIARVNRDLQDMDRYVVYDLGADSLLDEISSKKGIFRNTVYDPDELSKTHYKGHHEYVFSRVPFEVDVVLNLPKLKTHRKAGLTGALKNLVGLNGNKGNLPHHRVGGSTLGGDCYEGLHLVKRGAEFVLDQANRHLNEPTYKPWRFLYRAFLRLNRMLSNDSEMEGGWHGNDTTWRMVLDLNRILLYGQTDGTLAKTPQRTFFTLTDGIIAGEGFGPLSPEPRPFGAVTFCASSAYSDLCHAALMRFDWQAIPLLTHAFHAMPYPLVKGQPEDLEVHYRGTSLNWAETLEQCSREFKPARGWQNHIEWSQKR